MDVHASPAELPELQEFLGAFQVRFRRPEGREALERYTTGLLTELPNKNGDTIAQAVPGTSAQRLQEFLTNMQWDEEDLNRQRVAKMIAEATTGDGVLVFDDTGFPKQGKASVGVARQYSGTLGKVGNCQMAVTCCYTDPPGDLAGGGAVVLAARPGRRTPSVGSRRGCPRRSRFRPSRRSRWRCSIRRGRGGCPIAAWWPMPTMGTTRIFWPGLEARQEPYVVAVRTDFAVRLAACGDQSGVAGG